MCVEDRHYRLAWENLSKTTYPCQVMTTTTWEVGKQFRACGAEARIKTNTIMEAVGGGGCGGGQERPQRAHLRGQQSVLLSLRKDKDIPMTKVQGLRPEQKKTGLGGVCRGSHDCVHF